MTSSDLLRSELKRRTRFAQVLHRDTCESTQDIAAEWLRGNPEPPGDAIFWTDHQTRGRGRQERTWDAAIGLDLTVTFCVTAPITNPVALAAALPVAVLQTCEPLIKKRLRIKWPNDIYAGDRKLSGVLIDRDTHNPDTYRIGVGINVNRRDFPDALAESATSLRLLTDREHDRGSILLTLAEHVDAMVTDLCANNYAERERLFAERLGLLGKEVVVTAREVEAGRLTAINLERLVLDEKVEVPLAIVRSLQAAPTP